MPIIPADPLSITPDWLSQVLGTDIRGCKLEPIAIGIGLLGRLFRVHLDAGPNAPTTVIVKLPTLDTTARTRLCEPGDLYMREIRFYRDIGLANPLPPARPYFAAFDEATHDFVLVLEDLRRLRNADQTVGCTLADAETVIDSIALHHGHWWDNERLASLRWLTSLNEPPMTDVVINNYSAAWPVFMERVGSDMPSEMIAFGERLPSLMPWFFRQLTRPPLTFLHGDLRLDQLFFSVAPGDPPMTALDWQISAKGRGAYDVGYFLSQSLVPDTRRRYEDDLLDRYAARLAELGIHYGRDELRRDYRTTITWCFVYPVLGAGRIDITNERHHELLRTMLRGAIAAIEDHDGLSLGPD
jgi:Ecdysteroid kinase-like family